MGNAIGSEFLGLHGNFLLTCFHIQACLGVVDLKLAKRFFLF
jgi:hypothetical protein